MKNNNEENNFSTGEIFKLRALVEFFLIACAIATLSFLGYWKMNSMLTEALENSVERSVRTIAYELNKQLHIEINYLENQARNIENGRISANDIITIMDDSRGKHAGIIFPNGEVTAKNIPTEEIVDACKDVYEGQTVIRYLRGIGLVFAVPLSYNGQDCILFDYYNDIMVREFLKTISYNGDGTVILLNDKYNWTVIAEGIPPLINTHPDMDAAWERLFENVGYNPEDDTIEKESSAICYRFQDKPYFVYLANVSRKYHFSISGYVPFQSVAIGFQTMYTGLIIVIGLIVLVIIMVGRTLYKSSENKFLKQENYLALQAAKNKSDFLSNMSHEIRTPINAILGMDEMILRESKDKNILEYAENLRSAGNSLLSIVNDILDFSKIEAGKMEIIPVEYALSSVLNDLVNMIKPRADKKGLQLVTKADEKIPSVLLGDEIRIKQVVTNILTNAVKYTEKGTVTLSVDFEQRDENSIWLKFSVADTGIGIKEEDLSKLFSAFERIEEKRNRTIEGYEHHPTTFSDDG